MITDIFDKALELESGRLLLRPVIEDDADALFEIFSDREVMQYYDILPLKNKDEARELCDRFVRHFADRTMLRWAITEKESGQVIGTCGFFCFSDEDSKAELGYELRRDRWGMGFMPEAIGLIMRFIYENSNINRIEAFVEVPNISSQKLLKKLGFSKEGTLRQFEKCRGELIDITIWGYIRNDGLY